MNSHDGRTAASLHLSRRQLLGGAAALGGSLILAACSPTSGGAAAPSAGSSGAAKTSPLKIVNVPKWTTYPYFQQINDGVKEAAKALNATVQYTGPSSPDAQQQVQTLQTVVAQHPDIILLSAIEPNNVATVLKRARAQGITVVTNDADCAFDARDLYCNPLSYATAAKAYLDAALMDDSSGGQIVFMAATPTTANHMGQIAAVKQLIKTNDKYKVFTPGKTYFVQDDVTTSVNTMLNVMRSDPSVKFQISGSAVSTPAAAQAIVTAGKQGKVFSTGAALPTDIAKFLKDGSEKAFVFWSPQNIGFMAATAAAQIHRGQLKPADGVSFTAGKLGTFKIGANDIANYNQPLTYTKDNIDQYI